MFGLLVFATIWRESYLVRRVGLVCRVMPFLILAYACLHVQTLVAATQGRNFGLKSGGTNSERKEGALEYRGERGGEWGRGIPFPSDSWV